MTTYFVIIVNYVLHKLFHGTLTRFCWLHNTIQSSFILSSTLNIWYFMPLMNWKGVCFGDKQALLLVIGKIIVKKTMIDNYYLNESWEEGRTWSLIEGHYVLMHCKMKTIGYIPLNCTIHGREIQLFCYITNSQIVETGLARLYTILIVSL